MKLSSEYVIQLLESEGLVDSRLVRKARREVLRKADVTNEAEATLDLLIEQEVIGREEVMLMLSQEFDMEIIDLSNFKVSPAALEKVSGELAQRYCVFPLRCDNDHLELAISDPLDLDGVDSLSHMLGVEIGLRLASREDIEQAINTFYEVEDVNGTSGVLFEMADEKMAEVQGLPDQEEDIDESQAPIFRYVNRLITEAIKRSASDIHLEPLEKRFRVRFRVDGALMEAESPPKRLQASIISRLKLMANISIAEKRIPQDGRIFVKRGTSEFDLRVSSLPTTYGESIVMRVLDKEGLHLGLAKLGFLGDDQKVVERLITLPDGMLLVTGPTGSGKSTTLYSCLNYINYSDRKIITVEDPIEYQMSGVNQVQVKREVGMSFALALRSILRQAPNIIMIGEIRDRETAEISVHASLTGHMVFSTLHTNDAPSAVSRLIDIGVKPFLVSACLRAVVAQRLVRVICAQCSVPYTPDSSELLALNLQGNPLQGARFMKGKGCPKCHGSGYCGRIGMFEIFNVDQQIQQMIYEHATLVTLRSKAREMGMRTMREDGIRKVLAGMTTIEEVSSKTFVQ